MSVIFGIQKDDLIGATIVDVDGRDAEGDLFDLRNITLRLVDGRNVRIRVDQDDDGYLDVEMLVGSWRIDWDLIDCPFQVNGSCTGCLLNRDPVQCHDRWKKGLEAASMSTGE